MGQLLRDPRHRHLPPRRRLHQLEGPGHQTGLTWRVRARRTRRLSRQIIFFVFTLLMTGILNF